MNQRRSDIVLSIIFDLARNPAQTFRAPLVRDLVEEILLLRGREDLLPKPEGGGQPVGVAVDLERGELHADHH